MNLKTRDAAIFKALCRRDNWVRHSTTVHNVLWLNTDLRRLHSHLKKLHEIGAADLTVGEVQTYINSIEPDSSLVHLVSTFVEAPDMSEAVLWEAIRQSAARGLSYQAAQQILENHLSVDFNPKDASELLTQANEAFAISDGARVLDLDDSGLPDLETDRPNICSLGLGRRLDYLIGGGVAASELCIFLAGPKRGKTTLLSYIGTQAGLRGQRVMHITLENPPQMTCRRYDSALTGLNYEELIANAHILPAQRARITNAGGCVKVVNWQYEERSPSEIIPLVKEFGIDVVILDYLQLMIPDRSKAFSRKEQRHLYSKLGKDICRVGAELQVPVISAWQANREGAAADTVSEYDVAESWDIMQHASSIIGISANQAEKAAGLRRIHTLLLRYSDKRGSVQYNTNLERNKWEEINANA